MNIRTEQEAKSKVIDDVHFFVTHLLSVLRILTYDV